MQMKILTCQLKSGIFAKRKVEISKCKYAILFQNTENKKHLKFVYLYPIFNISVLNLHLLPWFACVR